MFFTHHVSRPITSRDRLPKVPTAKNSLSYPGLLPSCLPYECLLRRKPPNHQLTVTPRRNVTPSVTPGKCRKPLSTLVCYDVTPGSPILGPVGEITPCPDPAQSPITNRG